MRVDGGAEFPLLPNPARALPPPEYDANVDQGLVTFDRPGVLNTIDWEGFRVDGQYYFPGGRVRLAAVYTQAFSKDMADLYPLGGAEIDLITHIADRVQYIVSNHAVCVRSSRARRVRCPGHEYHGGSGSQWVPATVRR